MTASMVRFADHDFFIRLLQDSVLWIHMILMGITFGVIFPLGMVLGVRMHSTSRGHSVQQKSPAEG